MAMQYILSEEEKSGLVDRQELEVMTENFKVVLIAYQESSECIPYLKCPSCPLCSINLKRPKICDKQRLGQ